MAIQKTIKPRIGVRAETNCLLLMDEAIDTDGWGKLSAYQVYFIGTCLRWHRRFKYLGVGHAKKMVEYFELAGVEYDVDLTPYAPDGVTPYDEWLKQPVAATSITPAVSENQ